MPTPSIQAVAAPQRGFGSPLVVSETHGGVQALLEQVRPRTQSLLHAPQSVDVEVTSTHWPSHSTFGDWHAVMHEPEEQTWPVPQSPSEQHSAQATFAQQSVPAHGVCVHDVPFMHASVVQPSPSEQSALVQQTWQAAPQSFGVAGEQTHAPAEQIAPGLHAWPHAPQFAPSASRFVSQPALALQSPNPAEHTIVPPWQTWFGPTALPHPPQLAGSLDSSTHEPPQSW